LDLGDELVAHLMTKRTKRLGYCSREPILHLLELRVVGQVSADGLPHHGVLAHEDDGMAAERDADLLHLLRPDIVGVHLQARKKSF
jgi:hypothetical protein